MKKLLSAVLLLSGLILALPSYAAIYVDSANGNDANLATGCQESAPCATFAGSRNLLSSESTMYLSGTFNEKLEFYVSDSGTTEIPKNITVWPDREATIISTNHTINVLSTSYINFDGLNITNNNTSNKDGIALSNGVSNIKITDCTIYNIGRRGINVFGTASNITIENSTIHDIQQNGINIPNNGTNYSIIGNSIYNTGLGGSGSAILSLSEANISNNEIYNNAKGIFIDGSNVNNVNIANNFFYDNSQTSLTLRGQVVTSTIYNNSFYEDNLNQIIFIDTGYIGMNVLIKNNIFYFADTSGVVYYFDALVENFDTDYNLFYAPNNPSSNIFNSKGTNYTLVSWQAAGHDSNSLYSDPLLTSTTDLHLQSTSPAIDAGATLSDVTTDYDSEARPYAVAYDIGADELPIVTAPTLPLVSDTTNTTATLSWTAPTTAVTSYVLEYGTDSTYAVTTAITDITAATSTLISLTANTTYYYKVTAKYNTSYIGYNSTPLTSSFTTAPDAVTNLSATTRKAKTITLTWDIPTGTIAGYQVMYSTKSDFSENLLSTTVTTNTAEITSLTSNTIYYFSVTASNGTLNSALTSLEARTKPAKVKNVKVPTKYLTAATAKVKWHKAGTGLKYQVKLMTKKNKKIKIYKTPKFHKVISKLKANTTYKVKVRAKYDADNKGAWSEVVKFRTLVE